MSHYRMDPELMAIPIVTNCSFDNKKLTILAAKASPGMRLRCNLCGREWHWNLNHNSYSSLPTHLERHESQQVLSNYEHRSETMDHPQTSCKLKKKERHKTLLFKVSSIVSYYARKPARVNVKLLLIMQPCTMQYVFLN